MAALRTSARVGTLCALLVFIAASHAESIKIGSVTIDGLPTIRFGDTAEQVQKELSTSLEPEEMPTTGPQLPYAVKKMQLRLKTRGIWVFFEKDKVTEIRLDAPFKGNIAGVKLGDSETKIEKTFGAPVAHSKWGQLTGYSYYFDDVTTVRFMVNADDELETVFLVK